MPLVEIAVVLALVLLNGFFAMSEIAVVSARPARLESRAGKGGRGARLALGLARDPGRMLSTVQIGITLVGIIAGAFGGARLAEPLAALLAQVPALAPVSARMATPHATPLAATIRPSTAESYQADGSRLKARLAPPSSRV